MMYKIEKNIPIPTLHVEPKTLASFLASMKVGDSVLITDKKASQVYTVGWAAFGKGGCVTRKEGNGFRLWRVRKPRNGSQ